MSDTQPEPAAIRIEGGRPSAEEVAAATAVLRGALDELAGARQRDGRTPTAWQRATKGVRAPLQPGGWNRWGR